MDLLERLGLKGEIFQYELLSFGDTSITIGSLIVFVGILLISVVISRLVQRALQRALALRGIGGDGSTRAAKRLTHYVIMACGIGIAIEAIGVNLSALFAAGAIFAIGLGFAIQNIVQNFVSGVILLAERTIKPGDILHADNRFVKVSHMGIRATICRTLDEEEIIIPNTSLVQNAVTNYTLQDSLLRLRASVGVIYGSDMALVKQTLFEVARTLECRSPLKDPVVLLTDFADSAVVWEVSVWTDEPWGMRGARSKLYEAIWWGLKEKGIVIAFPQLDVHLDPEVMKVMQKDPPGA